MAGLPRWLSSKELPTSAGDSSSIPGLGRSPGEIMATYSSVLAWRIPQRDEPDANVDILTSSYESQIFPIPSRMVNHFQKVFNVLCPDPSEKSPYMAV